MKERGRERERENRKIHMMFSTLLTTLTALSSILKVSQYIDYGRLINI